VYQSPPGSWTSETSGNGLSLTQGIAAFRVYRHVSNHRVCSWSLPYSHLFACNLEKVPGPAFGSSSTPGPACHTCPHWPSAVLQQVRMRQQSHNSTHIQHSYNPHVAWSRLDDSTSHAHRGCEPRVAQQPFTARLVSSGTFTVNISTSNS